MAQKKKRNEGTIGQRWISFRPEIRILDCTIRDGGLMNSHRFDDATVHAVYSACIEAGIDYMELGYKAARRIFAPADHGAWKYCAEDDLRRIVGDNDSPLKLSAMADAEKTDYHTDILVKKDSVLDMIRVATYIHQIPIALDMIKDAHDKGYETTLNLMAASTVPEWELDEALALLAQSEVDAIYLVDSFGAMYSEQVHYLLRKFKKHTDPAGKTLGMHAHNNQQLAYANTIEAVIEGANLLDCSMAGLGRGAGNCPTELLVGFLHNPKYKLRPLLNCIQEHVEPLRKDLLWGFDLPYMITGQLNQHPRAAMRFKSENRDGKITAFFDRVTAEE